MTDVLDGSSNEFQNNNSDPEAAPDQQQPTSERDCGLPLDGNGSGTDPDTSKSALQPYPRLHLWP